MNEIFTELIAAYTPKDVTNIIRKIGARNIRWENVGNRRNIWLQSILVRTQLLELLRELLMQ